MITIPKNRQKYCKNGQKKKIIEDAAKTTEIFLKMCKNIIEVVKKS